MRRRHHTFHLSLFTFHLKSVADTLPFTFHFILARHLPLPITTYYYLLLPTTTYKSARNNPVLDTVSVPFTSFNHFLDKKLKSLSNNEKC